MTKSGARVPGRNERAAAAGLPAKHFAVVLFAIRELVERVVRSRTLSFRPAFMIVLTVYLSGCGGSGNPSDPVPTATPTPTPSPILSPSPSPNGVITIVVPTPAPVLCTPALVTIPVAQRIVISCTVQGYSGPITPMVADPTIASVQLAAGTFTLFYVTGLRAGTTTVAFQSRSGGMGQAVISVVLLPT